MYGSNYNIINYVILIRCSVETVTAFKHMRACPWTLTAPSGLCVLVIIQDAASGWSYKISTKVESPENPPTRRHLDKL